MPRAKATEKTVPEVESLSALDTKTELEEAAIAAALKLCEGISSGREREPYHALDVVTNLINALKK